MRVYICVYLGGYDGMFIKNNMDICLTSINSTRVVFFGIGDGVMEKIYGDM